MKLYVLAILFTISNLCSAQNNVILSTIGVGELKLGMTELQVSKILDSPMLVDIPDKKESETNSLQSKSLCKDCTKLFSCNYKEIDFTLTFFKSSLQSKRKTYKLVCVAPSKPTALMQTKEGIKIGLNESSLIQICKANKYILTKISDQGDLSNYFLTDKKSKNISAVIIIQTQKGVISTLMLADMDGD